MPAVRFGAGDLLEYNSEYSLLICRECQYAIQKSALGSHLLRHKIYRGDRQRLLSSIAQLDLLEPEHVPLPAPGLPPVNALPVLSGYRCTAVGCRHLTASLKRMKLHWSGSHDPDGLGFLSSSFARPAKLQTFFRGTKVRYFEVASPTAPPGNIDDNVDDRDDDHEGYVERCNATSATPPSPPCGPALPATAHGSSPADFNLDTLNYFHHFITVSSLTLPGNEDSQLARRHWQLNIIPEALRRRWLMCGLLAISARHLATLADNTVNSRMHRQREAELYSEFSAGLGQTTMHDMEFESTTIEQTKKTGEQIRCLLRCAQWASAEPMPDSQPIPPIQLPLILATIRGCTVPSSRSQDSGIRDDAHDLREEPLVPGFPQTRHSSYGGYLRTKSASDNTPSALLDLLHALPSSIAEVLGRPESTQDVLATLSAIATMVECCNISFACNEVGAA